MFRFIPPNTCPNCNQNDIPLDQRTTILLKHDLLCGYCGTKFNGVPCDDPPQTVSTILKSLIEHGLLHLDHNSQFNPYTLWGKDDNGSAVVVCKVAYSSCHSSTSQLSPHVQFKPKTLPTSLPSVVEKAAQLVSRIKDGKARMSMTMSDLYGDRKTLRFEVTTEEKAPDGGCWTFISKTTRVELSWTEPNIEATMFIPVYGSEVALELLGAVSQGFPEPEKWQFLQLLFNRYSAEFASRENAYHHPESAPRYLLVIRCNPFVVGTALIKDKQLFIGKSQRYESLADWWQRVHQCSGEWISFGRAISDALKADPRTHVSLEKLQ